MDIVATKILVCSEVLTDYADELKQNGKFEISADLLAIVEKLASLVGRLENRT